MKVFLPIRRSERVCWDLNNRNTFLFKVTFERPRFKLGDSAFPPCLFTKYRNLIDAKLHMDLIISHLDVEPVLSS